MGFFLLRRLLSLIPVWFGITLLTFLLVHSIPGGPFDTAAVRSPQATRLLEDRYHLHEPLWEQFALYVQNVFQGDLGESMVRRGVYVSDIIIDRFPTSLTLGLAGLAISLAVGIPAGTIAAANRNRWPDYGVMVGATIAYAIPSFVFSLLLILFVGLYLGWLPLGGWGEPQHVVLPAIALGLPWAGLIARLMRAAMVEVLSEDYIRTAHAKGVGPFRVTVVHGLRNALLPLTTVIAVLAAELITGSLIIEVIFGIPGVGRYLVESVLGSDYTMTLGLTVFYATLIFVANFMADVSYALLDPRIRLG